MLAGSGNLSSVSRAARLIRASGLGTLAAALLDHGGPLAFFGAQTLYFAAPVLDGLGERGLASDLAAVLDDPAATSALAAELRAPGSKGNQ
jgi:hypothetical protein